jgi:hypothetical protein
MWFRLPLGTPNYLEWFMTWNYRVIKFEDHLALHEVYYDKSGEVTGWTIEPARFVCDGDETATDIAKSLDQARNDAKNRTILIAAEYPWHSATS